MIRTFIHNCKSGEIKEITIQWHKDLFDEKFLPRNQLQANYFERYVEARNMTEVSFSRFIKNRTGISFIDGLNEIRLGHASRILIDTINSIAEVSYSCGFNNISNFNRLFKKKKGCTPKEFRGNFSGTRTFI